MATEVAGLGYSWRSSCPSTLYPRSFRSLHSKPVKVAFASLAENRSISFTDSETHLLECLLGVQGRGRSASKAQLQDVDQAVQVLEKSEGVRDPTSSSLIEGCWQLIFTTRPGTASPIQRTFVGVDTFSIFQEVYLRTDDPRVCNIVKFSDSVGELKVEAAASVKDGKRILFQFDRAAFSFKFLPFKVPYPVPFRLLGDEAKGWLDTTYLSHSGNIRISRGNKGTTFVLQKKIEPRQRLLSAILRGKGVREVVEEFISSNQDVQIRDPEFGLGEWQLLWSSQPEDESWLESAASGLKGLQMVKENGLLENQIQLFPGVRLQVRGNYTTLSQKKYEVVINEVALVLGAFRFPLDISKKVNVELLYIDNKIRITRGYKDYLTVHVRVK
ncbi:hypothetical protein AMTRI_Chr09g33530 [Amborella trichopoda]|uniref:Plastid lipid-associated protein/fibrillin conserved domain-containing protein n=1 Tax=Amborella trichopoda TaxID=13333 RepID=U5D9N8_AMBTC|nr:probable plastid-lipid-associated protein 12, chloroplastic [Amborella trichopoda]ERN17088.1 hypothetical protein AMTR_s00044p00085200 [Amborella trichopoda]|eukprot:XP_006855621.1 probable plastid-lipid-associated protein 12, chloroplastic [Amborella trichopoda]